MFGVFVVRFMPIFVLRDQYPKAMLFLLHLIASSDFLRLRIVRKVYRRRVGNNVLQQAVQEFSAIFDRELGVCCKLEGSV